MPILIGKGKNRKAYIRNLWLIVLCQVQSRLGALMKMTSEADSKITDSSRVRNTTSNFESPSSNKTRIAQHPLPTPKFA